MERLRIQHEIQGRKNIKLAGQVVNGVGLILKQFYEAVQEQGG